MTQLTIHGYTCLTALWFGKQWRPCWDGEGHRSVSTDGPFLRYTTTGGSKTLSQRPARRYAQLVRLNLKEWR